MASKTASYIHCFEYIVVLLAPRVKFRGGAPYHRGRAAGLARGSAGESLLP